MVLNYQFYHHQLIHSNVISGGSSTVIKKAVENGRDVVRAGNRSWYTMYIRGMFCTLLSGLHPLRWSLTDLLEVFFANCLKLGCFHRVSSSSPSPWLLAYNSLKDSSRIRGRTNPQITTHAVFRHLMYEFGWSERPHVGAGSWFV